MQSNPIQMNKLNTNPISHSAKETQKKMESQTVDEISQCFIKPKHILEESKQPIHFSPWDLAMLSVNYIQKGLLFKKPNSPNYSITPFLESLKDSLSVTLIHYYPLAGRLATSKQDDPQLYSVFIDCVNSPGAKFVHAGLDMTVADILSPADVPVVVQSFFDHDRMINHDGHSESLLTVQVTELVDGIFVGVSINHMIVDGTSYWNFFNAFSKVFKAKEEGLGDDVVPFPNLPIHKHWFPKGHNAPFINLPFTHHDQFISRHEAPPLRERIFHFSALSLSKLKSKANSLSNTTKISSLQALSAFMWIHITRIRKLPLSQITNCRMACNNRSRLNPPLPEEYFGNCIQTVPGTTTAGDLLEGGLGSAAWLLHKAVADHCDKNVRDWVDAWMKKPFIYQLGQFFDPKSVMMGSSPRFDMYGCEFGMGRGLAVLSGYAHKFDGKVTLYPAAEGGGAMDLEICLLPEWMSELENDEEFMSFASVPCRIT